MKVIIFGFILLINFAHSKEKVIAEVNGYKITQSELEETFKKSLLYPSQKRISKQLVLDQIINRRLGIDKANSDGLKNDPQIQERFNDILHNAVIFKDLENDVAKIKVTDKDVKTYYKNHKEYKTSHILLRVRAIPSKEEVTRSYEIMATIYARLMKKPSSFEKEAKDNSQIASNENGGDIGYLPPTSLAPEYYAAIKGKPVGHITKPIRTQFGFHIIKVTGVKEYEEINKDVYKKILFNQKRDRALTQYYNSLRKSAKVKILTKKL